MHKDVKMFVTLICLFSFIIFLAMKAEPNNRWDYKLDIHDYGDGHVKLLDMRDGVVYDIPFDSIQTTIIKLNE